MLFLDLFIEGLVQGGIYALIAIGLTLVYGLLRILHVAHAGMFTLGGYLSVWATNASGSFALSLLGAALAAGVAGILVYRLCYRPILHRPPHVALIASIGLYVGMEELFRLFFGPYGMSHVDPPLSETVAFFSMRLKYAEIAIMAGAVLLISALAVVVNKTRLGMAWRATVAEPQMALSCGINNDRIRDLIFFIGSALAALAGAMVALVNNYAEPTMGAVPAYKALAIIVLAGLGDVGGTLLAALALGVIESFGTIYLGKALDRDAIAFAFMIAVLMLRPRGLFGKA